MQLGAVTYNVFKDMDLETLIKTLEATGYTAVELRTGHKHGVEPTISEAGRQRVKDRFEHSKVRLLSAPGSKAAAATASTLPASCQTGGTPGT